MFLSIEYFYFNLIFIDFCVQLLKQFHSNNLFFHLKICISNSWMFMQQWLACLFNNFFDSRIINQISELDFRLTT